MTEFVLLGNSADSLQFDGDSHWMKNLKLSEGSPINVKLYSSVIHFQI